MMKISKNFNLLDRLLNTKSNYTKTLEQDKLYSKISRDSLDALKLRYGKDLTQEEIQLLVKLKKVFNVL